MDTHNPNLVNIFIEASTKEKLVELQVLTNHVNAKSYNFQTPYKEDKKWIVWFYADFMNHIYTSEEQLPKVENPNKEGK